MKIFITGASGFVGGAATRHLAQAHDIIAMSRSDISDATIRTNGATPIRCALGGVDPDMLAGVDSVIHCAAYVKDWGPWEMFERLNIEGTRQLLEAAEAAGVRCFIHISTEAALFHGQHMRDVDESTPLALTSPFPYSRSKAMAEKLVRAHVGEMETIALRPRMIWGPKDQTILPVVLDMHAQGKFVWINGGAALTSTTHIANLVQGIECALSKGIAGSVYFVLDGAPMRFREFMATYAATAGVDLSNKSMPSWLVRAVAWLSESVWRGLRLKSAPPLTRFTAAIMSADCTLNDDLARAELGYVPVIDFTRGMAELS